jgi:hypothetical protein
MGIYFSRPAVVVDPYPLVYVDPYPTVMVTNYGPDYIVYDNACVYFGGTKKLLKDLNLKELKIISKKLDIKYNSKQKKNELYKIIIKT